MTNLILGDPEVEEMELTKEEYDELIRLQDEEHVAEEATVEELQEQNWNEQVSKT